MHVALFTHQYPTMHSNGGAELSYSLLKAFKNKNYKISLFILAVEEYYEKSITNKKKLEEICENVFIYRCDRKRSLINSFKSNPLNFFFPDANLILPAFDLKDKIHELLNKINPDKIFIYDWWSSPAAYTFLKPKSIIVGDLLHFPAYTTLFLQKQIGNKVNFYNTLRHSLATFWSMVHYSKIQKKILKNVEVAGSFGKKDAEWLKKKGILNSKYYKTPYFDVASKMFLDFESRFDLQNKKIKIATSLGRLNATATGSGLYLLKTELINLYDKIIGRDNYEIHIYGDGFLKESVASLGNEKNVFVRGYVDDIDKELLSSDVFLLATNVYLGYRCRIINGLCRGLPMVLSKYDTYNQPELKDGYNCLVGHNSDEIAKKTKEIVFNKELRMSLMKNARQTYIDNFQPDKALEDILSDLDQNDKKTF